MMTKDHSFCSNGAQRGEQLVAYLYDDLDPQERESVESHLSGCAVCREELVALRGVRTELAGWAPPEPARGFSTRANVRPARAGFWAAFADVPAWAQAAAAVLCVGVAAGLANLEVRYDGDGLVMRTGWSGSPSPARDITAQQAAVVNQTAAGEPWRADLAELERQLRSELGPTAAPASAPMVAGSAADLTRVRSLIDESEQRQKRELALRLADVLRDVQYQRRDDLEKIDRSLGLIQANLGVMQNTGVEVMRQRQMINDLAVRVSQR